jgi:hypothetical protein
MKTYKEFLNETYSVLTQINRTIDINLLYRMLYDLEEKIEIKKKKGETWNDYHENILLIKKRIKKLENEKKKE